MEWRQDGNRLVIKNRYETLWLEPWGTDALRVRATQNPRMSGAAGALNPAPTGTADIRREPNGVSFLYSGPMDSLLEALRGRHLEDLHITEPDLEEIFLHYYEGGALS